MKKIYSILITIVVVFLASGQSAWAANTWTVEYDNGKFKITRSGDLSITETVQYRTVSLSAFAGQHFTSISGTETFGPNQDVKEVSVSEGAPGTDAYKYQNGSSRAYGFEVLDECGFRLAYTDRSSITGTNVPISGLFNEKEITIYTDPVQYSDAGYNKGDNPHYINSSSYYSLGGIAPAAYYTLIGAQLRSTLSFDAAEKNNGYQYVQILTDNISTCDSRAKNDGDPGTPSLSRYMAGFDHDPGSKNTTYAAYTFPVTSQPNNNSNPVDNAWSNGVTNKLYKQRFNTNCRATDGRLIIPVTFSTFVVRFNASGGGLTDNDEWYAKNVKAHIQAVDGTAPQLVSTESIIVSSGPYNRGTEFYISVPFREIVTISGDTKKLTTSWGDATYEAGSSSNVLTFKGTINVNANTTLSISGLQGTIADLAGNTFSGSLDKTFGGITSVDPTYTISYDLDGGTVATANPTSYQYTSNAITLNNPTRPGYRFDGWTGSNGNTPQTSVTINKKSHGNRSYTANWTQMWTGNGTQGSPYTITSTDGLDYLASYVNAGNNCSGIFFQLGNDITYTASSLWNNESSTENNFTPIARIDRPFCGRFDGQNYTISGIRIYRSDNNELGLFSKLGADGGITRVVLANTRLNTGVNYVGGIVGMSDQGSTISYCTVRDDVAIFFHNSGADGCYRGGIAGDNSGDVRCCISSATLTSNLDVSSGYGGIVGMLSSSGTVRSSIAKNAHISTPSTDKGLIYGTKSAYNSALVNNYYLSCTVGSVQNQSNVYSVTLPEGVTLPARANPDILPGTGNVVYSTGARIDGVDYYKRDIKITLNCTVPQGYTFGSYTVTRNDTAGTVDITQTNGVYSFQMPAGDVTVSASYIPIPWSGSGTEADPWIIIYPSQMELLATNVNGGNRYSGKYFRLGNDLTYSHGDGETENNYTVIGDGSHSFEGSFDGDGHTISGIRIYSTDGYNGLFAYVTGSGTIQNVTLADAVINGSDDTGGVVGRLNASQGLVCNCIVKSDVLIKASTSGADYHGGIVGYLYSGIVRACISSAHLTPNGTGCSDYGGISGVYLPDQGTYIECCLVIDAEVSAYDERGIVTGYSSNNPTNLSQNYYFNCKVGPASSINIGYGWAGQHTSDKSSFDGAVEAAASTSKPGEIGVQTASYPGGVTVFERGLYYNGVYYIAKNREGKAVALTMVQGTKDGVTAWWGTFYDSTQNYTLSEGAAAYTLNYNYNLVRIGDNGRIIPMYCPVVIISTVPEVYLTPIGGNNLVIETHTNNNPLQGVNKETTLTVAAVLTVNGSGEVGFYRVESVTIPAHKAYLEVQ